MTKFILWFAFLGAFVSFSLFCLGEIGGLHWENSLCSADRILCRPVEPLALVTAAFAGLWFAVMFMSVERH
jgi:hypothetical protein